MGLIHYEEKNNRRYLKFWDISKKVIHEIRRSGDYNVEVMEPGDVYEHDDNIKINFVKVTKK